MKNKFIEQVTAQIQNKTARTQIEQELESHMLDKIDYYVEIGYPYEEAERRATEEMGSPDDTALPLNSLHKDSYSFLTLIGGFYIIILFFLSYRFSGAFSYIGYTENAVHYIKYDFISFGIFLSYAILLIAARKKHNKNIPLLIIISFVIQIIFAMIFSAVKSTYTVEDIFAVFQPMSYAMLTLISSSLGGYIDSIFAYESLRNSLFNEYSFKFVSMFFVAVIVLWSVAVYVSVRRKENMSAKRSFKRTISVGEKVISAFLAVNLFVMCFGTAVAISELSAKYDEIVGQKTQMINYIVNADMSKDYAEQMFDMQDAGFNMSIDVEYNKMQNESYLNGYKFEENLNCMYLYGGSPDYLGDDNPDLTYRLEYNMSAPDTVFSKNLLCYADDMKTLQSIKIGDSLEDVIKTGIVQKADYIENSIGGGTNQIYMTFEFDADSFDELRENADDLSYSNYANLKIIDGRVTESSQQDDISMLYLQKKNMLDFIIYDSQMKWDDSSGRSAEAVLRLLDSNDIPMTQKKSDEYWNVYANIDSFNELILYHNKESDNYSLEYYNIPDRGFISIYDRNIVSGYDAGIFDEITDDMTLYDFTIGLVYTCAGIVKSSSEYDENTQRYVYTTEFIFPVKDGDNINQYIVEFYDGVLTKHYQNDESFLSIGYPAVD